MYAEPVCRPAWAKPVFSRPGGAECLTDGFLQSEIELISCGGGLIHRTCSYRKGDALDCKELILVITLLSACVRDRCFNSTPYLEVGYTVHLQGHSGFSATPDLPQLAGEAHAFELAIKYEILNTR